MNYIFSNFHSFLSSRNRYKFILSLVTITLFGCRGYIQDNNQYSPLATLTPTNSEQDFEVPSDFQKTPFLTTPNNPTATTIPRPTNTPNIDLEYGILDEDFPIESSSYNTAPGDILEEIEYFVPGGEGYPCIGDFDRPKLITERNGVILGHSTIFVTCGWEQKEIVHLTLTFPNGQTKTEQIVPGQNVNTYAAYFSLLLTPLDPIGVYHYTFEGSSGNVSGSFEAKPADEPMLYILDDNDLLLHKFAPGEDVNLFVYERKDITTNNFKLIAWDKFQTNANGQLIIHTPTNQKYLFVAIGETSGQVPSLHGTSITVPSGENDHQRNENSSRVYDFYACPEPCLDDGDNSLHSFPEGTTSVSLHWKFENIPIGSHYIRSWTMNGKEWVRYDCIWPGPVSGEDKVTLREPGGLFSGLWEVTISLDDVILLQENFIVDGNWKYWDPAGVFNNCY